MKKIYIAIQIPDVKIKSESPKVIFAIFVIFVNIRQRSLSICGKVL